MVMSTALLSPSNYYLFDYLFVCLFIYPSRWTRVLQVESAQVNISTLGSIWQNLWKQVYCHLNSDTVMVTSSYVSAGGIDQGS